MQKTLQKYAKASSLQFNIKKIDEKIVLGTKSESQGLLKYQNNKIYILQNGDKKVEVFYFGKNLTLVEYPDADFNAAGKRKVTILKNTSSPLVKSLLNLFSDTAGFNKQMTVISEKTVDGVLSVELSSKAENMKNLALKINVKDLNLMELSFVDDVETKTTLQFEKLKLGAKIKKSEFQYKPLKTDEVLIQ